MVEQALFGAPSEKTQKEFSSSYNGENEPTDTEKD